MRKLAILLALISFLVLAGPAVAGAAPDGIVPVKVIDLAVKSMELDGSIVTFTAEAIGDTMRRSDGTWVNVLDSTGPIGVFMSHDLADRIRMTGRYSQKGDMIEVVGVFNRACAAHGGDPEVHALSVTVVAPGYRVSNPVARDRLAAAGMLAAVAAALAYLYFRQSRTTAKEA